MLYGAQISQRCAPTTSRVNCSTGSQAHLSELDELAGEPRDVGQLAEPLADSVLNYTLRRLRPNEDGESPAVQTLEQPPWPDDLSQLMNEDCAVSLSNPAKHLTRTADPLSTAGFGQSRNGEATVLQVPTYWEQMRAPAMPPLHSNDLDWWELGLENTQQPILPYDELFNLDFNIS